MNACAIRQTSRFIRCIYCFIVVFSFFALSVRCTIDTHRHSDRSAVQVVAVNEMRERSNKRENVCEREKETNTKNVYYSLKHALRMDFVLCECDKTGVEKQIVK